MIFVDTSVWVDYFRVENTTLAYELDRLLDQDRSRSLPRSGSSFCRAFQQSACLNSDARISVLMVTPTGRRR